MRFVIFGGNGFIGSAICERLIYEGHEVTIFARKGSRPNKKLFQFESIKWVFGDFLDKFEVSEAIKGQDGVYHFISTTKPSGSNQNPAYDIQSNLLGTLNILDAMLLHDVKLGVYASSGGTVYGVSDYLPIDEEHPTNPIVSYGITKLTVEKYLSLYNKTKGLNIKILRISNPYGKIDQSKDTQGAVDVFINKALKFLPVEVWGDGSVIRDYIYIDDVVTAAISAMNYHGPEYLFNIGSGVGVSLNDVINIINSKIENKMDVKYVFGRPYDVPVNILSNSRAKLLLNWYPSIDLEKGIQLVIDANLKL